MMIFIGFTSKGCFLETSCAARWRMNVLNLCLQREICDSELHNMSRLHINSICTRLFPLSVDSLTSETQMMIHWDLLDKESVGYSVWITTAVVMSFYTLSHPINWHNLFMSLPWHILCRSILFKGTLLVFVWGVLSRFAVLKPLTLKSQPAFITYINIFHLVYFSMFALQVPPRADLVFVLLFLSTQKD